MPLDDMNISDSQKPLARSRDKHFFSVPTVQIGVEMVEVSSIEAGEAFEV